MKGLHECLMGNGTQLSSLRSLPSDGVLEELFKEVREQGCEQW